MSPCLAEEGVSFPPIGGLEPGGLVVKGWCPLYPLPKPELQMPGQNTNPETTKEIPEWIQFPQVRSPLVLGISASGD